MTRDEIMNLGLEELEERANAIAVETAEADKDQLETLNAELDAIEERKKALNIEIEERKKAAEAVANGAGKEVEERKDKKMTSREFRSTPEYIDAYAEYVKKGLDLEKIGAEKRALLTENATDGTIAVPTYIEDRINTAWENNEIMRRVRRTYIPGNVKVGVEVSAQTAVIHTEGGEAISPEELNIEYINLIPEFVKKLVEVSHSVLESGLSGTAFLDYLYDEIEYQIVKRCGMAVLAKIGNSSLTETVTLEMGVGLTTAKIIEAEGKLEGDANPVLLISRANAAALKATALSANYGYDPFDGLEVIYADTADTETYVVDLSAVQCNFPDGAQPKFIFDEYTKAAENIVRIIGRLNMACDLVRTGAAVKLAEETV